MRIGGGWCGAGERGQQHCGTEAHADLCHDGVAFPDIRAGRDDMSVGLGAQPRQTSGRSSLLVALATPPLAPPTRGGGRVGVTRRRGPRRAGVWGRAPGGA
jgi:hypothetical protein